MKILSDHMNKEPWKWARTAWYFPIVALLFFIASHYIIFLNKNGHVGAELLVASSLLGFMFIVFVGAGLVMTVGGVLKLVEIH